MNVLSEIKVPQESVNDESVTVIRVSHAHGSRVTAGQVVIELETSKLNISLEADANGFVYYSCKEGDEVRINELLFVITDSFADGFSVSRPEQPTGTLASAARSGEPSRPAAAAQVHGPPSTTPPRKPGMFSGETAFSAKALELIEKHVLSHSAFTGRDLVASEDVLAHLMLGPTAMAGPVEALSTAPGNIAEGTITRKSLPKSKKREIDYLRQVQQAGLNSTVNIEVNTNGVLASTGRHSKYFKQSFLPVITYETSRLLRKFPQLNAFYLDQEILFYNDVNVGVAIDIDDGLKTVCIRKCDSLGIRELEDELFSLSNKYVDRKLVPSDLSNITFTITDLSAEGVCFFSPLINQQNAAILGIAAPKPNGDMILSITFDHRVTEGKTASRFLRELKERLECYKNQLVANSPDIRCCRCLKQLGDDFSSFGFLKVTNKAGEEGHLCQSCFKGL